LETLRQLVATYGSSVSGKTLVMASDVQISDRPMYAYRGFMLDTARHYFPISTIKRHIDAMAHSKLNVFHWHATDSHSFRLDLDSAPLMSKLEFIKFKDPLCNDIFIKKKIKKYHLHIFSAFYECQYNNLYLFCDKLFEFDYLFKENHLN